MQSIAQVIQWYLDAQARQITYSMIYRNGPNSYDCSSAGYFSLIRGGLFPADIRIGNTDSAFGDLERSGWVQLQPNAQGNYDTQRGDIAIWGKRGASSGGLGHYMTFLNANDVIHCNSYYDGIAINNYDELAGWNGSPEQTFYRYTGESTPAGDPNDQNVDVGSFIKFPTPLTVEEVELSGGVWQANIQGLAPAGFTWEDNGVPTESLVEIDGDSYATSDQDLGEFSTVILPGKYQVLDLGESNGQWVALINYGIYKFWVDIAGATEVPDSDPGTPTPGHRPEATTTPPAEEPVVTAPDPPVPTSPAEIPPTTPTDPVPSIPAKETNEVKEPIKMSFTEADQKALKIQTEKAQDLIDEVSESDIAKELAASVSQRTKIIVYIIGDSLIGLGLLTVGIAVVVGWTDVTRIAALSGVFSTAGGFLLTLFGIYKSKK